MIPNYITLLFPIRGHSFLPNDRDSGTVKKLIKSYDRVYLPKEYVMIKKVSCKFSVETIDAVPVLDFKRCWSIYYKKTFLSESSMGKIPKVHKMSFSPSKWMAFEYNSSCPGQIKT